MCVCVCLCVCPCPCLFVERGSESAREESVRERESGREGGHVYATKVKDVAGGAKQQGTK